MQNFTAFFLFTRIVRHFSVSCVVESEKDTVASIGSVATLPKNGLPRRPAGPGPFACWDNPKPFLKDGEVWQIGSGISSCAFP